MSCIAHVQCSTSEKHLCNTTHSLLYAFVCIPPPGTAQPGTTPSSTTPSGTQTPVPSSEVDGGVVAAIIIVILLIVILVGAVVIVVVVLWRKRSGENYNYYTMCTANYHKSVRGFYLNKYT